MHGGEARYEIRDRRLIRHVRPADGARGGLWQTQDSHDTSPYDSGRGLAVAEEESRRSFRPDEELA